MDLAPVVDVSWILLAGALPLGKGEVMTIDTPMLTTLQRWASVACFGRPYRLEIWTTGGGHIIADVWETGIPIDDPFSRYLYAPDELMASSQIGWEGRNYFE